MIRHTPTLMTFNQRPVTLRHMLSFTLACAALVMGCGSNQPPPRTVAINDPGPSLTAPPQPQPANPSPSDKPDSNRDPCAMRLHDLSGPLLFYIAIHGEMPRTLNELKTLPDVEPDLELAFTCPVSGRPYTYNPAGIEVPGVEYRIYAWDSTPAHGTYRWAIQLVPSIAERPPYAAVVPVPEESFPRR